LQELLSSISAVLHKFYPIVPDALWLMRIVPLGVRTVQLRIKGADDASIREQVRDSLAICRRYNCQLIVNDYWQMAIELGGDFVHLGQEDLAAADVPAIRKASIRIGVSTHAHAELDRALAIGPDYVALGPIYETKLKAMAFAPQGLARISEWKRLIACPLVAIGGITLERAPAVFAAGADSIAVVTDIIAAPDPDERVRAWVAACS
jgi:thiamine-phosphate pyrophosphorylase